MCLCCRHPKAQLCTRPAVTVKQMLLGYCSIKVSTVLRCLLHKVHFKLLWSNKLLISRLSNFTLRAVSSGSWNPLLLLQCATFLSWQLSEKYTWTQILLTIWCGRRTFWLNFGRLNFSVMQNKTLNVQKCCDLLPNVRLSTQCVTFTKISWETHKTLCELVEVTGLKSRTSPKIFSTA